MVRMVVMLAVVALLVATLAVPAFAAASGKPNCIGRFVTGENEFGKLTGAPGYGGRSVKVTAQSRVGLVGEVASACKLEFRPWA